ncbi:hypothetical protein TNCV_1943381 [Trichonephila clavipes]|nr:hypothetical protein TNCV_1943381 [Trichonephila clavipes]
MEGNHWKNTYVGILLSSSLQLWTRELCFSYLPRPEGQNLNLIKLQLHQEWRDGLKADEMPNKWPRFHLHNECRHLLRRRVHHAWSILTCYQRCGLNKLKHHYSAKESLYKQDAHHQTARSSAERVVLVSQLEAKTRSPPDGLQQINSCAVQSIANMVSKNGVHLALPLTFRYVSID